MSQRLKVWSTEGQVAGSGGSCMFSAVARILCTVAQSAKVSEL